MSYDEWDIGERLDRSLEWNAEQWRIKRLADTRGHLVKFFSCIIPGGP